MDPAALKLILDAFNRRFDEMEARLDRRFSPLPPTEPRDAVEEIRIGATTSAPSVASAPICSSTIASTDEPSPDTTADHSALHLAQAPSTKEVIAATSDPSSLAPMQPQAGEAGAFESEAAALPSSIDEPYRDDAAGADHSGTGVDLGLQQAIKVLAPLAYHEVASLATQAAQQKAERSGFIVVRAEQEMLLVANSTTARQSELHVATILAAPLDTLLCVRLCPVKCVLRDTPLGGYDGSLDDDPEPGVAHFDALLDQAAQP